MSNEGLKNALRLWNLKQKSGVYLEAVDRSQLSTAKQSDVWDFNLHGETVERIIIYLRSTGCVFALKSAGCTMCAHSLIGTTLGEPIDPENFIKQFESEYHKYETSKYPVLCLYNEGNILNPAELPWEALEKILALIHAGDHVKRLIIESRPEYITEKNLELVTQRLGPDIELEVGIGLESVTDFVRDYIMLKETSRYAFERSVKMLNHYGIKATAYVILKPPFLNEAQAINETLKTGMYAFKVGCDAVSIEPINVEPYTIVQSLYKVGLFSPPWLWSVLKCGRELAAYGEVRIGGNQFSPVPETRPSNCPTCNARIVEKIRQYNTVGNPANLRDFCENCYSKWEAEISSQRSDIDIFELSNLIEQYSQIVGMRKMATTVPHFWRELMAEG